MKLIMKKTLLFLLLSLSMFAQELKQVPLKIAKIQSENKTFSTILLFTKNSDYANKSYEKEVKDATIATLNSDELNTVYVQKPEYIEFKVPYDNKFIDVVLYKVEIFADDFQLDTDKNKNVQVHKGVHYRGIIKNNVNSIVSFNFFKNEVNGMISAEEIYNLNIGKLNVPGNSSDYVIYSDAKLVAQNKFICDVKESKEPKADEVKGSLSVASAKCVTLYFELDYNTFVTNGSNLSSTYTWMSSVFNNIQTLYANDGITTAIKSVFVWTTLDPYYGGSSSTDYLNAFVDYRRVFNGDLGQLISTNAGGFGGLAYLNGLCASNNYGYSDVNNSFATVPNYSWTVEVITHEVGHQMGSQHTHACAWNGNNTAIDGCGPTAGYSEGSCPIAVVPYTQKGTIMSYCHLVGGVGINFANGFGPQPAARILGKIAAAPCLSTDCINTCINTVADLSVINISQTSARLTWTDVNTAALSWEVAAVAYPYNTINWITVTSNSYVFNGLNPNTLYKFMARPICTAGLTVANDFKFAATDAASVCSGVNFTDSGTLAANYGDNENWTRTYKPSVGSMAKVVFTSVSLENNFDFLYVYDGVDTNSNLLAALTGNQTGTFQATNATGALTFEFISDEYLNQAGWNATISCAALGTDDFNKNLYSYYPNPVTNELNLKAISEIQKIQVFSIDGKIIYESTANDLNATINMASFAKGSYIVKLKFNEGSSAFKILKH